MHVKKKLWLTRPADDSEHLAHDLARHGIETIVAPVKAIVPHHYNKPARTPDALLLTSRHAAYALADFPPEWRELPIYCVGHATAEYVKEHGCRNLQPGSGDVVSLLPRIAALTSRGGHIVYLAGEDRSVDVPALLAAREITVTTLVVYRARAEITLAPSLVEALHRGEVGSVAFFSSNSADVAIHLLKQQVLEKYARDIEAFCFSQNIAKTAAHLNWKSLHTCHVPTKAAMTDLIISKLAKG